MVMTVMVDGDGWTQAGETDRQTDRGGRQTHGQGKTNRRQTDRQGQPEGV